MVPHHSGTEPAWSAFFLKRVSECKIENSKNIGRDTKRRAFEISMATKPPKKNQEAEALQERIVKLEKQLESFQHSNDYFLKNKLFLHYDIKELKQVVVQKW